MGDWGDKKFKYNCCFISYRVYIIPLKTCKRAKEKKRKIFRNIQHFRKIDCAYQNQLRRRGTIRVKLDRLEDHLPFSIELLGNND